MLRVVLSLQIGRVWRLVRLRAEIVVDADRRLRELLPVRMDRNVVPVREMPQFVEVVRGPITGHVARGKRDLLTGQRLRLFGFRDTAENWVKVAHNERWSG